MSTLRSTIKDTEQPQEVVKDEHLLYPVDMSAFLLLHEAELAKSAEGEAPGAVQPAILACSALAHWNCYVTTGAENERELFITLASWFVQHEVRIGEGQGGWPTALAHTDVCAPGLCLSALTQGCALSLLTRAYQLTHEACFLDAARRAVRTFEQDILDGGVSSPIGSNGIFFEEVAVYPATHSLNGFCHALFGLYDYVALTHEQQIEQLIQRSLATLHEVMDEFSTGFWLYTDLLHRRLATPQHLAQQVMLFQLLADTAHCEQCQQVAKQWRRYQSNVGSRLRYRISQACAHAGQAILKGIRKALLPEPSPQPPLRVCVPLNSLFVTGGILTVLRGVAQVTENMWNIEFLTRYVGDDDGKFVVHEFGSQLMAPWQFPTIWVYIWDGFRKLFTLLRRGAGYHVLMPQDGVFSAAFSGLAARLSGARTVCIDHANLTLTDSDVYREERKQALKLKKQPHRFFSGLLLVGYWPSLALIARLSARCVDHFLVPGVAGDGIEEICKGIGIPQSRLTRFASMINIERHIVLSEDEQRQERERKGLPADALVVAIVCRLSTEKGLEVALESIGQVLATLSVELRSRLRVVIAGDGPLRASLEAEVEKRGLRETCVFWGDISADEVIRLLAIAHVFLYTSTRGACIPMAVLEAMASGCAVIATTQPVANAVLLAEERGIIVPPWDAEQTAEALRRLVHDVALCHRMGEAARDYIAIQHSPQVFRRLLQRATFWSNLDDLLPTSQKAGTV